MANEVRPCGVPRRSFGFFPIAGKETRRPQAAKSPAREEATGGPMRASGPTESRMPGVSPGEYLTVRGQWVRHATYGTQFRADVVERRLPQGLKEIFHYLASGAIKGIGKATARQLIETFGEDALRVIEEEPEKLTTLKGISPKRARTISDAFRKQMGMRRLLEFLTEHQLPAELSGPLYRAYGDVALEVVRANPYVLASVEFGVEFSQADALALSLGIAADDPQRLEAGLLFELSHNNWNNGHTFLPAQKLIAATGQLLEASGDLLEERLEALANRGELDRETIAGQDAVGGDLYRPPHRGDEPGGAAAPRRAGPDHRPHPAGAAHHLRPPAAPGGGAGRLPAGDAPHRRAGHRQDHLPAGGAGPV